MNCLNCIFKKNISGSNHVSCNRRECEALNINLNGAEVGAFAFPYDFNHLLAESCTGYIPKNWKNLEPIEKAIILLFSASLKNGQVLDHKDNYFKDSKIQDFIRNNEGFENFIENIEYINIDIENFIKILENK